MPNHFLVMEIGGTKLQLGVCDEKGKIREHRKLMVEQAKGAEGIRRQIANELPRLFTIYKVKAIGVGFGGPVDWSNGRICRSHQIAGWSEFRLAEWLETIGDVPAYVDNDANVAALGEAFHGAGIEYNPVFYVTLGSGVGGGLVTAGEIYHGARPGESEVGHLRLSSEDKDITVESRCSGWAVDARIRSLRERKVTSLLCEMIGETPGGEAKHLAAALVRNDSSAVRIVNELSADLAYGLSHVVHLFHPEIIILGGGLSFVGEPLRSTVESALTHFHMESFLPGPCIELASLGEDVVLVGAFELARSRSKTGLAFRQSAISVEGEAI